MDDKEIMKRIHEKVDDYKRGFSMVLSFRQAKLSDIEDAYLAGAEEALSLKSGRTT